MKAIIITAALAMISSIGYSQSSNKDEMVKKIFATFKNKDEEAFVKLFPDAATIKKFFFASGAIDTSGKKEELAAFMAMMSDSSMRLEYLRDFKKYIKKGEKNGVDWTQARLVSYTADSLQVEEDGMKMTTLKGKVYFNVNEKEFYLEYSEVIWFDNKGWYGVNIKRVDKKSNESIADNMSEDEEEMMAADSTRVPDSIAIPAKPKPVQKQKVKQPVKPKAKPKTQTPAKKPE